MKNRISWLAMGTLAVALAFHTALADEVASKDKPEASEPLEEVIVTGVLSHTVKKDATFSINTLTNADIRQLAPMSTADLLQNVPGIFAEGSTAGEASNNITVRGLPVTGGFRYAPQLIDGLPWYEEPEVQFMNNDVAVRDDLMTERVEVVKGGTGGVLYSNGLGATVNHITRTGGQTFKGGYRVEATDYNLLRNEFFLSGPLSHNLTFAVGGFYRTSNGIRDTGYTADRGGQVRGNIVYTTDDDRTEVQLHAMKIDDRTAFYQNVPFQVPGFSQPGTPANPVRIDQNHIWPLGINFQDGTVASPYDRIFTQMGEYGQRQIDLADGIHPNFDISTLKLKHEFESGWTIKAGIRRTSGTNDFNAMFTGNDSTSAPRFLTARFQNDVVSKDQQFPAYLNGTGVAAYYLGTGARVPDTAILNFLLPFIANVKAESTSADFQLNKSFELAGKHSLTLGGYDTAYSNKQNFQASLLVASMEKQSQLVDLRVVDATGTQVGPSLTSQGAILPGFFGYVSDMSVQGKAFYALDHWDALDDRLKIDIGVRWQDQKASVVRRDRQITAGSNLTPASVVPGSTADTAADDQVQLPGAPRFLNGTYHGTGWSVGGNYSLRPNFAVYGLISKSFRLPSLEDLNEFRVDPSRPGSKVEKIMQYEGGLRYYANTWDTQIALFYNKFDPRQDNVTYQDFTSPQCTVVGGIPQINTCPQVREFYIRGIKNLGIEVEAAWHPRAVEGLELRFNGVAQKPTIVGANYKTVKEVRVNDVITGYKFEYIGENGRTPRRLAEHMLNLRASYDTKPLTGLPFKPYVKYTYFGSRYSESQDINVTLYPAYYHIDAGFIWDFSKDFAFQLHVANITNQLSFTEGDPLFFDLKGPNGATNRGVGRPLFGRTLRASFTYFF